MDEYFELAAAIKKTFFLGKVASCTQKNWMDTFEYIYTFCWKIKVILNSLWFFILNVSDHVKISSRIYYLYC